MSDPNYHWRLVECHWDCGHGPSFEGKCDYKIWKAVETAGDLDTFLLDKTGTITIGNRKATQFYLVAKSGRQSFLPKPAPWHRWQMRPLKENPSLSLSGINPSNFNTQGAKFIAFSAETRSSGIDISNGLKIRKGAFDSIQKFGDQIRQSLPY